MRSKVSSGNGRRVASPLTAAASASGSGGLAGLGAWPRTGRRRPSARRRRSRGRRPGRPGGTTSKAWRPAPQPRSSTQVAGLAGRAGRSRRSASAQRVRLLAPGGARYCSTVCSAVCRQVQWSMTRWRPAAPTVARSVGVVEGAARCLAASASLSPGGTRKAVSPSVPTTSGRAPPVVATSGTPQRHRLDGRQREALVERRHDGQLGLGVELDDALVGHAGDELDVRRRGRAARWSRRLRRPALRRPMTTRWTSSRSVRSLASASSRYAQALHGDVGAGGGDEPARDRASTPGSGRNRSGSTPTGHDVHALGVDLVVVRRCP